ncbi:hypothetical protein QFZ91_006551 [Paraburkholderia sp. JPY419]
MTDTYGDIHAFLKQACETIWANRVHADCSAEVRAFRVCNPRVWPLGRPGSSSSALSRRPLFKGSRLKEAAQLREAQQQEAAIAYEETVLGAWQEVDDALVTYEAEQRRRDRLAQAVTINERALSVAQ